MNSVALLVFYIYMYVYLFHLTVASVNLACTMSAENRSI